MHLTPSMRDFILNWGEMGSRWGLNRSVAQIHALLHLSPQPLAAETIAEVLGLARSNVSGGLKELLAWGLIKSQRQLGQRRDHFVAVADMFDLAQAIAEARRSREFAPALSAVRNAHAAAKSDDTPKLVRKRMKETLDTMEAFDAWYRDIAALPRPVQQALLKLGAGVAKLIPKAKT